MGAGSSEKGAILMKKLNTLVCLLMVVVILPVVAFAQTQEEWNHVETLQQPTDVFEVTDDGRKMQIVTVLDEGTEYVEIERIVTQAGTAFDSYFYSDSPIEWIRISYRDRMGNIQQGWIVANTDAITGINMSVFDVTSDEEDNQRGTAIITGGNADRVHLRAKLSQEAESLGLYFAGTPVKYTGNLNETWVSVQIGSEYGYMMSAFLSNKLAETYPFNAMRMGIVHTNSWVNLRAEPSTNSEVLMQMLDGESVVIMGETSSHWYYVTCNSLAGYVKADYIEYESLSWTRDPITSDVIEVIAGEKAFWHTGAGEYIYIQDVGDRYFGGKNVSFPHFAIADVDQDTNDEIILAMTVGGDEYYGYLVLKSMDSTVWGYEVFYRAMLSLKADGTFSFSSGALDTGFGYTLLDGDQIHHISLAESVSSYGNIEYFLNGKEISETLYRAAVKGQDQKPDVIWYDLTNENLSSMLKLITD